MLDQKVKHISAMKFVTDQESRRFQFEFSLCTEMSLSNKQYYAWLLLKHISIWKTVFKDDRIDKEKFNNKISSLLINDKHLFYVIPLSKQIKSFQVFMYTYWSPHTSFLYISHFNHFKFQHIMCTVQNWWKTTLIALLFFLCTFYSHFEYIVF